MNFEKDSVSRSWFCVFNNPLEDDTIKSYIQSYNGEINDISKVVCEYLSNLWCGDGSTGRTGAWLYCISENGLHHIHMVLEDIKAMRFSAVKKVYQKAHIEATKGNKSQVLDYINKKGKFEEKGEKVISKIEVGEIRGCQRGKRNDLENIKQMIDDGLTPNQIIDTDINMLRLEDYINKIYYRKKLKDTPYLRDVKVYWHFGESGTGKSYKSYEYVTNYGRENVYIASASAGGGRSPFDNYQAQKYLFIDELRSNSPFFDFSTLLSICNPYTIDLQARYHNKVMLWNEVHITTPEMPYEMYSYLDNNKYHDKLTQIYRRIDYYVYHYIGSDGQYHEYIYDNTKNKNKVTREYIIYLASKEEKEKEKAETIPPVSTSLPIETIPPVSTLLPIEDIIQRAKENNIPCIINNNSFG